MELVGAQAGSLCLWEEAEQILRHRAWFGHEDWLADVTLKPGEGVSGTAAQRRAEVSVNDYPTSPYAYPPFVERLGITAVLAEPLIYHDQFLGVISADMLEPGREFTEESRELLTLFAAHAAIAIENARLHAAALRRGEELGALLRTTRTVMSGLDLPATLERVLEEASHMAGTPHVKILLVDEDAGVLRLAATSGAATPPGFQVPLGTSYSGTVASTGQPLFVADTQNDPRNLLRDRDRETGILTYLGLPIRSRDKVVGVLTINTEQPRGYNREELEYLEAFAGQAGIALENARLYAQVQGYADELETRVQERTAELADALRVKAEFLARMSHELRTPLNFVLGFADLLHEQSAGPLTAKQRQFVDRIQRGGRQLLTLVTSVLDLSQAEGGQMELRLERFPLAALLEEVLEAYRVQNAQKRLQVDTACPSAFSVVADRRRLGQILHNLVSNAVKFTPEGGRITLTARTIAEAAGRRGAEGRGGARDNSPQVPGTPAPEQFLELVVEDTGIGMAPGDLERVLRGFEQVDGSSTRQYEGAGIGLALVRTLVALHGGQVWAESAGLGQGSRFIVRHPVLPTPTTPRVLVVEDEPPVARLLATFLADAGYAVEVAETGRAALASLAGPPPDLVVLDLALADTDGWEVLRTVRASEQTRALPVVVLTGLGADQAEHAAARGADEFLTKPVSPSVLAGVVKTLLARSRETDPSSDREAMGSAPEDAVKDGKTGGRAP